MVRLLIAILCGIIAGAPSGFLLYPFSPLLSGIANSLIAMSVTVSVGYLLLRKYRKKKWQLLQKK